MAVKIEHIVPGSVLREEERPERSDRAYWQIKCPACGEIHERTVQKWWDDDPNGNGGVVEIHCFVCARKRLHYRIAAEYPFEIVMTAPYGAVTRTTDASRLPDDNIPF